jgi:hypothetical protein
LHGGDDGTRSEGTDETRAGEVSTRSHLTFLSASTTAANAGLG